MPNAGSRLVQFTDLQKGNRARVSAITSQDEESERLQEMGLTIGTEFCVVKIAPFGDPIEIELRGYRLCLRKRETSSFEIELLS